MSDYADVAKEYCTAFWTVVALKSQGRFCPPEALSAAQDREKEAYAEYLKFVKAPREVNDEG